MKSSKNLLLRSVQGLLYQNGTVITEKALCISICCSSPFSSNKEALQESLEQVLRILNPNKISNTAIDKLERNMENMNQRQTYSDEQDCDQPDEVLPEYTETIIDFPKRELRQLESQKHYPICHLERRIHRLNTNVYEYRPAYYEEVRCLPSDDDIVETNEICSSLGFTCVQWNKTIHLTRRRFSSDCWETKTMVIPAGCECMWPVQRLGDIGLRT